MKKSISEKVFASVCLEKIQLVDLEENDFEYEKNVSKNFNPGLSVSIHNDDFPEKGFQIVLTILKPSYENRIQVLEELLFRVNTSKL